MSLLREIAKLDQEAGPITPDGWSIGHLANHGLILSCDGFQVKLDTDQLNKFFDIAENGEPDEVKDHNGNVVLVEPTNDSIILTRTGDEVYPSGVVMDLDTLKEIGIEKDEEEPEQEEKPVDESAVKPAFRRSGKTIKKGFRVTSGYRKGRVVADIKTAYKPKAKATTRLKLRIASKKKRLIRILKSRRTRKKALSKRLARMNAQ